MRLYSRWDKYLQHSRLKLARPTTKAFCMRLPLHHNVILFKKQMFFCSNCIAVAIQLRHWEVIYIGFYDFVQHVLEYFCFVYFMAVNFSPAVSLFLSILQTPVQLLVFVRSVNVNMLFYYFADLIFLRNFVHCWEVTRTLMFWFLSIVRSLSI